MSTTPGRSLRHAVSSRLAGVPPATRRVVQPVAALGAAGPELLAGVTGLADASGALTDAVERGLLVLDDAVVVRCSHPLLASVALAGMAPAARRGLHPAWPVS